MTVAALLPSRIDDVRGVEGALRELLHGFDADSVLVHEATELWSAFDRVERLAASAKALLARRVEDAATWRRAGYRSTAEQLAGVSGTSVSAARNLLETSKRVDALPATADALRAGNLSLAKAEAIVAAAAVAPGAETQLIDTAMRTSLAEVREACLRAKARVDRDATHERIRRERRAREYTDAEGAWNFSARGTPDAGAAFRAAYEPIVDEMFKIARREGRTESRDAYAFDALVELARRASAPAGGGETGARLPAAPRFLALIRVDQQSLRRGAVEGDEVCEIAGLGPVPVRVARDLLGDAILKLVVTRGADVINVTHLGRSATVAQKVALWWRSPTCLAEGCTRTQRLERDHRLGWAKTRRTRVDELDLLCKHHHDLKTYDGWELVAGEGSRSMVPPGDPRHPRTGRRPPDP